MKALVALGLASCLAIAGCTVQPLYGGLQGATSAYSQAAPDMAAIYISQPQDRVHQQVRNNLAFMFYGGGAQPTDPRYHLDFTVTAAVETGATYFPSNDNAIPQGELPPSSQTLILTALYSVVDVETGEQITVGRTATMANFDNPAQELARQRAQLNAEDRAARELAAQIGLDVAAKMRGRRG